MALCSRSIQATPSSPGAGTRVSCIALTLGGLFAPPALAPMKRRAAHTLAPLSVAMADLYKEVAPLPPSPPPGQGGASPTEEAVPSWGALGRAAPHKRPPLRM